jgi:hypothetical protein
MSGRSAGVNEKRMNKLKYRAVLKRNGLGSKES